MYVHWTIAHLKVLVRLFFDQYHKLLLHELSHKNQTKKHDVLVWLSRSWLPLGVLLHQCNLRVSNAMRNKSLWQYILTE